MKPALPRAASRDAFTLIEILVVIAIIAILASLLLNTAGYIQEKAGNARAEVEIKALETALESYKQDNGDYPDKDNDGNTADGGDKSSLVLLNVLNRYPATNNTKIYLSELGKMIPPISGQSSATYEDKLKAANALDDPFGNPYHYEYKSTSTDPNWNNSKRSGTGFFNLWSKGKKNVGDNDATGDDTVNKWIKNW